MQVISAPSFANIVPATSEETHIPLTRVNTAIETHSPFPDVSWSSSSISPIPSDPNLASLDFSSGQLNTLNPPNPSNPPTGIQRRRGGGGPEPYPQRRSSPIIENEQCQAELALAVPQRNMNYPSPSSEVSTVSPCPPRQGVAPGMLEGAFLPITERSPSSGREMNVATGDERPNDDGLYQCRHKDCVNEPQMFARKCEFT